MLFSFLVSASNFLSEKGEVNISLRDNEFYNSWNLKELAVDAGMVEKLFFFTIFFGIFFHIEKEG